jgi:hypothetical protein
MTHKAVQASIVPYGGQTVSGQTVSRMHKDTARLAVLAEMRTEDYKGEQVSQPGTLRVEVEVNTSGLVAVTATNADAPRTTARPLFYGQVAIGGDHDSGTVIRCETYPPARPDGAVNLSAAQAETIRAALATMANYATTHNETERHNFYTALDTIWPLVGGKPE